MSQITLLSCEIKKTLPPSDIVKLLLQRSDARQFDTKTCVEGLNDVEKNSLYLYEDSYSPDGYRSSDGFRWKQKSESTIIVTLASLPTKKRNCDLKRYKLCFTRFYSFLCGKPSTKFKKIAYWINDDTEVCRGSFARAIRTLIHYIGEGNHDFEKSKSSASKSVIRDMKKMIKSDVFQARSSTVYNNQLLMAQANLTKYAEPRNQKQAANTIYGMRLLARVVQHDELYAGYAIGAQLPQSVAHFALLPELDVWIFNFPVLKLVRLLVSSGVMVLFSYDTTFDIGNYYVSFLVFHNSYLKSSSILLLASRIHSSRKLDGHQSFLRQLLVATLKMESNHYRITVDREPSIVQAILGIHGHSPIIYCALHMSRNLRYWLSRTRRTKAIEARYRYRMASETILTSTNDKKRRNSHESWGINTSAPKSKKR